MMRLLALVEAVMAFSSVPGKTHVRIAQFNAYLNRFAEGQVADELQDPSSGQAKNIAQIIQMHRPDILSLQEFDYDAEGRGIAAFQKNYLSVSQQGYEPIEYPYVYASTTNTGKVAGLDLDNNGVIVTTPGASGYGGDCYGFGAFPGQYAMVLLSKYPLVTDEIRTFQTFLWKDVPQNEYHQGIDAVKYQNGTAFYNEEEKKAYRLSSKNHVDAPVKIGDKVLHILQSHPTPPVFDGEERRNYQRNADEINFFRDYVGGEAAEYIYDDKGTYGGLKTDGDGYAGFVIVGDQNADSLAGDGVQNEASGIISLLNDPHFNPDFAGTGPLVPRSQGGICENNPYGCSQYPDHPALETTTSSFGLRADYAVPSANLETTGSGVFWPAPEEEYGERSDYPLVGHFPNATTHPQFQPSREASSDHRLVMVDIYV